MYCKTCEIEWKLLSKCPVCDYKNKEKIVTNIESIKKCSFTKEDIIILTCRNYLSDEQVMCITTEIKRYLPDNRILLLEGGLELSVLAKEEE